MKKIFLVFLISLSTVLHATQFSENEINAFVSKSEADLVAWLKKEGKSHSQFTQYYLNAAEQVHMLHQYTPAKILYKKALGRKDLDNKLLAYLPLISLSIQEKNLAEASKYYQEAETYLKANPQLNIKTTEERMTLFKLEISGKHSSEGLTKDERASIQRPNSNQELYWYDLKQNLINKKYDEAFKMIEGRDFTKGDVNLQILADVIYTGAKKSHDTLYCQKDYDLYPVSHETSYSMKLCGVLIGIKAGKKISEKEFNDLKDLIKLRYPENLYLEQVARDLAAKK